MMPTISDQRSSDRPSKDLSFSMKEFWVVTYWWVIVRATVSYVRNSFSCIYRDEHRFLCLDSRNWTDPVVTMSGMTRRRKFSAPGLL